MAVRVFIAFLVLFSVWLVWSGHFDTAHIGYGMLCSALVAVLSADLLIPAPLSGRTLGVIGRLLRYVPWLFYEIVVANLHMVYLVWNPSKMRPQIVHFQTELCSDLAKTTLGNSITLTPGTVTLDVDGDTFTVHAVSDQAAQSLATGEMEHRVGYVFMETGHNVRPSGPAGPGTV